MTDFRISAVNDTYTFNPKNLTSKKVDRNGNEVDEDEFRTNYTRNTIDEVNDDLKTMIESKDNLLSNLIDKVVIKIGGKNGLNEISQEKYKDDEYLEAIIEGLCSVFNTTKESLCLVFDGDNNEYKSGYSAVLNKALSTGILVVAVKKDKLKLTGPFMEDWGVLNKTGTRTPPDKRPTDDIDYTNFYLINIPPSNQLDKETLTLMANGSLYLDTGHLIENYFNFNSGKMRQGGSEIFRLFSKLNHETNLTLDKSESLLDKSNILEKLNDLETKAVKAAACYAAEQSAVAELALERTEAAAKKAAAEKAVAEKAAAAAELAKNHNDIKSYYDNIKNPKNRHFICIDQSNAIITDILNY